MQIIHTDKAPAAVGPYSQAIIHNDIVYTSGQIAIDPSVGKIVAKDIEGQAEQCCKNIEEVLKAAGTNFSNVIKTTCFLAEIADFKTFNAVYVISAVCKLIFAMFYPIMSLCTIIHKPVISFPSIAINSRVFKL